MYKHTTSGFCPQGHLVSDWLAPVEAKEGSCRGQRRAAVEDWLNKTIIAPTIFQQLKKLNNEE